MRARARVSNDLQRLHNSKLLSPCLSKWDKICTRIISSQTLQSPKSGKRVWSGVLAVLRKECHNCIFVLSGTRVSDASVHVEYYTARFAKARDGRKVYWDSWKQAARRVFALSDSFQNIYDRLLHAIIVRSSAIWDRPRPMWQEVLLRTC